MTAQNNNTDDMLLVLLAGQSNMAGRDVASPDDLREIPGLLRFAKDGKWRPAIEPITRDRDFVGSFGKDGNRIASPDPWDNLTMEEHGIVRGVGPGRTFGRLLLEANPGRTVGLIPTAVGGTPLASWKRGGEDVWAPGSHPYDDSVAMAKEAMKYGKIVAVLWHQGETDASRNNRNYKADLKEVICNFREDLNLNGVPFLLGELASFYKPEIMANVPFVDRAMYELAEELPAIRVVKTKDLRHKGDNLHFDTESAHRLGERYFSAFRTFH